MFETLDDRIKQDDKEVSSPREKYMKWAMTLVVTVLLFGGLYVGMLMMEQ
jgi:hypothetical protein